MEQQKYINAFGGPWHIAKTSELRTKSGELLNSSLVPLCSGRQIGGAWGPQTWRYPHAPVPLCKRCVQKMKGRAT